MNKNILFEIALFDPDNTLTLMLQQRDVEFRKVAITQKFVVALDETIEVISNDNNEPLIEKLVSIFIEWLKEKPYRKLQAQLVDGSIVYIDECDIEGTARLLKSTMKVTAFDQEYNNRILNS
ncbi:hypothetical protein [Neptunomonas sp.]|uniref:hypothetical protein n=1 Tax=Neptunomonas sp. TaxID=1971898 RepID=UPI0025CC302F|nr:hypothetical protein [Neptunomonas sp.]